MLKLSFSYTFISYFCDYCVGSDWFWKVMYGEESSHIYCDVYSDFKRNEASVNLPINKPSCSLICWHFYRFCRSTHEYTSWLWAQPHDVLVADVFINRYCSISSSLGVFVQICRSLIMHMYRKQTFRNKWPSMDWSPMKGVLQCQCLQVRASWRINTDLLSMILLYFLTLLCVT